MQIMPSNSSNNSYNNENTATRGVTPVGVTIARSKRSRRKSLKKEEQKPKKKSTNDSSATTAQRSIVSSASLSSSSYQKPVSSWNIFWEGSAVYAACLIVPTVMAYIVRHHEYRISLQQHQQATARTSAAAYEQEQPPSLTLLSTTMDLAYSLALEYIWTEPVRENAAYYLCPAEQGPLVYYLGADYMPTWSWCPKPPEQEVVLMSPDATWTDLNVVILISFTLALIRLVIVRIVLGGTSNFWNDSTRMQAMLKCKSTHLLSRDYHLTPCGTPVLVKPRKVLQPHEIATAMAAAVTTATAAATPTNGGTSTTTAMPRSSFFSSSRGASSTGALVPPNMNEDDEDHDDLDDENALDDNDDYVMVGLLLDDASDHGPSGAAAAPRRPITTTTSASSFIFPPAPPLSRGGEPVVRPQQQQPDSPLEYLTDASIRRCNSTSSGLGGGHRSSSSFSIIKGSSSSTQRLISPMNLASSSSSSSRVAPTTSRPAPERLYAAPRLATAVFRLAYTTVSVVLAWHSFYTADFWPWYVGGGMVGRAGRRAGSTMHVWDLNGGAVSLGTLDSDFDLRNTVLRRYFLVQASYHFHSTAFHVLSMIIYLIQNYRSKNNEKKENTAAASANPQSPSSTSLSSLANPAASSASSSLSSSYSMNSIWKVSTTSYLRSLLHHTLALLMYATAYIFSSLRRLVAIGMFAFDVSSLFLHLLQIFVNAKNDNDSSRNEDDKDGTSRWQKLLTARRIQYFHLYFVLPSFVYCRFGVWGALWFSAWTESGAWLQQLETTLFPNAALILQSLWNVCMAGLFVANLIYLRRLLHHPHLKRICLRENK